ncbi:MAG TPA: DAK2 domain-containing protein [Candidatus Cottocaccamicrobium excrementipullorum]|nr:DAK2 domain-containing protein [Candidatus Cottocaccamicrobium excrementipullorum]
MNTIDASLLQKAFLAGAANLEANKEWINELNVFPVPDGDTGTNMTLTIMAAAREAAAISNPTMDSLSKAISSGSLRGARGNSGVILSQLFRGFTKEIKQCDAINTDILSKAMTRATETAYKAVMKPKEGTILTVARGMSEKAALIAEKETDILAFCQQVIEEGDRVLSQTPEMLPVLKEAGVVDSGGQGLMVVVKGCLEGLMGKEVSLVSEETPSGEKTAPPADRSSIETANIKFGYCTEFIINTDREFTSQDEEELKTYLEGIGDSLVVVADEDMVKVHVHTNHPGLAFEKALTYGSLSRMKIDNMREEHEERLIKDAEKLAASQKAARETAKVQAQEMKEFGFIAVSAGEGLSHIFKGIGADCIIEGGQTMNPSTEDILTAVNQVNARRIFILPNNKNIILAAEQAAKMEEKKELFVVPSATIPQGITALINFSPDLSPEENMENMVQEMKRVKTGQITYAVRTTAVEGIEIHEGDIIAIGDQGMLAAEKDIPSAALKALQAMIDEESELVTLYFGTGVSQSEAEALQKQAQGQFPQVEIELQNGGQPVYYYLISVE